MALPDAVAVDRPLRLGSTMLGAAGDAGYYTLKIDFEPKNTPQAEQADLLLLGENRLKLVPLDADGGEAPYHFDGVYEQHKQGGDVECVAYFDGNEWTLQLVTAHLRTKHRQGVARVPGYNVDVPEDNCGPSTYPGEDQPAASLSLSAVEQQFSASTIQEHRQPLQQQQQPQPQQQHYQQHAALSGPSDMVVDYDQFEEEEEEEEGEAAAAGDDDGDIDRDLNDALDEALFAADKADSPPAQNEIQQPAPHVPATAPAGLAHEATPSPPSSTQQQQQVQHLQHSLPPQQQELPAPAAAAAVAEQEEEEEESDEESEDPWDTFDAAAAPVPAPAPRQPAVAAMHLHPARRPAHHLSHVAAAGPGVVQRAPMPQAAVVQPAVAAAATQPPAMQPAPAAAAAAQPAVHAPAAAVRVLGAEEEEEEEEEAEAGVQDCSEDESDGLGVEYF